MRPEGLQVRLVQGFQEIGGVFADRWQDRLHDAGQVWPKDTVLEGALMGKDY